MWNRWPLSLESCVTHRLWMNGLTCTKLRTVQKCYLILNRWPLSFRKWPNSQWFDLYKTRYLVASQVHQLVYSLAEDYYHRNDISNEGFYEFYKLFDLHPQASMFVLDELHLILFAGDRLVIFYVLCIRWSKVVFFVNLLS